MSLLRIASIVDLSRRNSGPGYLGIALLSAVVLFLAFQPQTVSAQVTTADIVGALSDQTGAVLPGVTVTLENPATGSTSVAITDDNGFYAFRLVPPGAYIVKAELSGFRTAVVPNIRVSMGDRVRQDIRLELGELTESVEVVGAQAVMQREVSSIGTLLTSIVVADVPLSGRNFIELAQAAAGAHEGQPDALSSGSRPDDRRRTSAVSINAQDPVYNNFLFDGMDNNERFIGTIMVKPSVEVIQEMKVTTNLYPAELGRTTGGVVNFISKSGTNRFRGSAFEYFRNEALDARNFFATTGPKPLRRQHNFGGSIGGPIVRNRTFFFADYEAMRMQDGKTLVSTVPTEAMRQGNFSGMNPVFDPLSTRPDPNNPGKFIRDRFPNDTIPSDRVDPVGRKVLQLFPVPNVAGTVNNFTLSPKYEQDDDTFDVRIDHRLSDNQNMFVRYSFNNTSTFKPGAFPITSDGINPVGDDTFSGTSDQRAQNVHLTYVNTISSSTVLELKGSVSRYRIDTLPFNYGKNVSEQLGIPGANVDAISSGLSHITFSGYRTIGDPRWLPIIITNNVAQGVGNIIYMRGRHSFKFGTDLRYRQVAPTQSAEAKGRFNFDANLTNDPSGTTARSGNALASLLLGFPASTARIKYLVEPLNRFWEWSAFMQDDLRVTDWLTLNLGIRYDFYGNMVERYDRLANGDLARGIILVAGQDGVSRTAGLVADTNNFAPRLGFAATLNETTVLRGGYGVTYQPSLMASVNALRNPPFMSLFGTEATVLQPNNLISQGLPFPLPSDPKNPDGSLSFVGLDNVTPYYHQMNLTLQRELPGGFVASAGYAGVLGRKTFIYDAGYRMNDAPAGPGAIQPRRPFYSVWPKATAITTTFSSNNTSYNALQVQLERRFADGYGLQGSYTWAKAMDDASNLLGVNRTTSQEKALSYLDVRHRMSWMGNAELPFLKTATGLAGILGKGWKVNAKTIISSGIPVNIVNASARSNTGGSDRPNLIGEVNIPGSERTVTYNYNPAALALPALYTFGNLGRNAGKGRGQAVLDISFNKDFQPTENTTLQFRTEVYNITNTPSFRNPSGAFGSSSFGVVSAALPARSVQFALKFLF